MSHPPMPTSHGMIAVDIEKYGGRNDQEHRHLQEALIRIMDVAAANVGVDRTKWSERQPQGDAEFSWLPPDTHLGVVIGPFVTELNAQLGAYNRRPDEKFWSRMRLRMAIHYGPVYLGAANGVAGRHAVQPARLLDSPPIRAALDACPAADLAVIVSDRVYDDYISQGLGDPSGYRAVRVQVKEHHGIAYLRVPGHDISALSALDRFDPKKPDVSQVRGPAASRGTGERDRSASVIIHGDHIGGASHQVYGNGTLYAAGRDQQVNHGHREG